MHRHTIRAALLLAAATVLLVVAAPAQALSDAIGSTLRSTSVYVDPAVTNPAHTITEQEADALSAQIAATGVAIYVAVLSAETAGTTDPKVALEGMHEAVGTDGAYAVVLDDGAGSAQFLATATGSHAAEVAAIATASANAHRNDLPAALQDFVGRIGERYGSGSGIPSNPATTWGPLAVGAVVVAGGGYWLYRRNRAAAAATLAEVRHTVDEDVTAYGEVVAHLDTDDPQLAGDGQAYAQQALDAYEDAKAAAARMTRPEDARAVTTALEAGRFALACVEARRAGAALPERRPPCFVDPRHGPSVKDIAWAVEGGTPRPVPVCQACAVQLESGQLPPARQVLTGGRSVPYWRAGGAYRPYATGYYTSFDGVLPAILVGSMFAGLGGGLGGGFDQGGGGQGPSDGGWGGPFGGGDSGFGGGDFGGGDIGGGDFGGGGF